MSHPDNVKPYGNKDIDINNIIKVIDTVPVIPGYKVEKLISGGAMGQVYLAIQEALERPVAIKVINPSLSIDATFRQRFLKEGKIVARLRHPYILTIHDIGECLNQYYMVMEYVEGGTLKNRIQKGLSAEQAVNILRQIASALGHAHRQGFIHRDIKPANILFRDDNNAVLSDFGIAKACEDSAPLTATGLAIGTILYMSPEQAQGKTLDSRSDLYSLGLVFFEMLTGFRPDRTPDGATELLPAELSHYQRILDRLLARNPNDRFNTAEQLIEAIDDRNENKIINNKRNDRTVVLSSVKEEKKFDHRFNKYSIGFVFLLTVILLAGLGYMMRERSLDNALSIDIAYSYRPIDQLNFRSLPNGGILRSGDYYQIRFTPDQDSYIYIFQIDSSGEIYRLFPSDSNNLSQTTIITNPVQAKTTYFIPAQDEAFQLDDQIGQEQIYVLAFQERNINLENQYIALIEARRLQNHSQILALQAQLTDGLKKTQVGVMSVLNFKHTSRGSHDL
ncbi:MAG TPA: serine/threonine-protein kinase [Candidatus Competibacteraceae bacterium]|nr:serine/threonine-protein kinase [Candidatus Competibacteraceae bacterium]